MGGLGEAIRYDFVACFVCTLQNTHCDYTAQLGTCYESLPLSALAMTCCLSLSHVEIALSQDGQDYTMCKPNPMDMLGNYNIGDIFEVCAISSLLLLCAGVHSSVSGLVRHVLHVACCVSRYSMAFVCHLRSRSHHQDTIR